MPPLTSISAQLAAVAESTWGVPVTPSVFVPMVSETMAIASDNRVESNAIIAGARVLRSGQWDGGLRMVGGDLGLELPSESAAIRLWLEHMMGTVSGSGPWTFTPGSLAGKGLTVQVGVPGIGGTVWPKTYPGCKVNTWEIGWTAGEIVTFGLGLMAKTENLYRTVADGVTNSTTTVTSATAAFTKGDIGQIISGSGIPAGTTIVSITSATSIVISAAATATATGVTIVVGIALASASYASGVETPFHAVGASCTIAGSTAQVKQGTLSGANGLTARPFAGSYYTDEPLETELREYTGELDLEFNDLTQYKRFTDGAEAAMVVTFRSGVKSLALTYNCRFDGDTPQVGGREVVGQGVKIKAVGASTDAGALTMVYTAA